jgi:hypothetical protein
MPYIVRPANSTDVSDWRYYASGPNLDGVTPPGEYQVGRLEWGPTGTVRAPVQSGWPFAQIILDGGEGVTTNGSGQVTTWASQGSSPISATCAGSPAAVWPRLIGGAPVVDFPLSGGLRPALAVGSFPSLRAVPGNRFGVFLYALRQIGDIHDHRVIAAATQNNTWATVFGIQFRGANRTRVQLMGQDTEFGAAPAGQLHPVLVNWDGVEAYAYAGDAGPVSLGVGSLVSDDLPLALGRSHAGNNHVTSGSFEGAIAMVAIRGDGTFSAEEYAALRAAAAAKWG